jgi:hypothetical protein
VGGAAVAPALGADFNIQSSSGRIQVAAGSNFLQINGFDANGVAAPIVMGAQGQGLEVNGMTASSIAVSGAVTAATLTASAGVQSSSYATSGKVGTVAAPVPFTGGTLGYSGVLQLFTLGGVGDILSSSFLLSISLVTIHHNLSTLFRLLFPLEVLMDM